MTENKKERIEVSRLIRYFLGLFIMTAGIAISVKSDLVSGKLDPLHHDKVLGNRKRCYAGSFRCN